jgi:hypothetical protein
MTAESRALVAQAEELRSEVEAAPRDSARHRSLVACAERLLGHCEFDFRFVECDRAVMLGQIAKEMSELGRPSGSGQLRSIRL